MVTSVLHEHGSYFWNAFSHSLSFQKVCKTGKGSSWLIDLCISRNIYSAYFNLHVCLFYLWKYSLLDGPIFMRRYTFCQCSVHMLLLLASCVKRRTDTNPDRWDCDGWKEREDTKFMTRPSSSHLTGHCGLSFGEMQDSSVVYCDITLLLSANTFLSHLLWHLVITLFFMCFWFWKVHVLQDTFL